MTRMPHPEYLYVHAANISAARREKSLLAKAITASVMVVLGLFAAIILIWAWPA